MQDGPWVVVLQSPTSKDGKCYRRNLHLIVYTTVSHPRLLNRSDMRRSPRLHFIDKEIIKVSTQYIHLPSSSRHVCVYIAYTNATMLFNTH